MVQTGGASREPRKCACLPGWMRPASVHFAGRPRFRALAVDRAWHIRLHGFRLLLVLASGCSVCEATSTTKAPQNEGLKPGRIWPDTPELDVEGIRSKVQEACSRIGVQGALNSGGYYLGGGSNHGRSLEAELDDSSSLIGAFVQSRREDGRMPAEFAEMADACNADGGPSCGEAFLEYLFGLAWPFVLPLICSVLTACAYCVCCFVGCCRCCRRQACCREREEPREATRPRKMFAFAIWCAASAGIAGLGVSVHEISLSSHVSLNAHLCAATQLASDAIGGREDVETTFLGTERGLYIFQEIARALDVDGETMRRVRKVISSTAEFAHRHETFRRRIAHFTNVVALSGPAFRAYEHRCVFCSLAVGDPNNFVPGYPAEGLLRQLSNDVDASSSEAMHHIRRFAESRLMGESLTSLASGVKRGTGAMAVLDTAMRSSLSNTWARQMPSIDAAESVRLGYFFVQGVAAMGGAALGLFAFFNTRVRQQRRPDIPVGGKMHCFAWCCGFCYAVGAFFSGGCLLLAAVSAGEACEFARLEVLSYGMVNHRQALGLVALPPESDGLVLEPGASSASSPAAREAAAVLAVSLAQTCFTANGTGDLLATMDLVKPLAFQQELTNAFIRLEDVVAEPPAGAETAEVLDKLRNVAAAFGDLFVLDPLPLSAKGNSTGALGILELSSNVKDLLLGSTLDPEDRRSPNQVYTLKGLNSYAALIAGPGKYTFASGTAGGGFVITPDKPTDEDLASLPAVVRNALLYGRAKEKLLASNSSLRCDELDDKGVSTVRHCGVKEFHQYVIAEVDRIADAAENISEEAAAVRGLFLGDLNIVLLPMLRQVRDLRTIFNCRFLYHVAGDVHGSLCHQLAPTIARGAAQLLALAASAILGIVVQYKVWRHLKDNKVVAAEIVRFQHALNKFEEQMLKMKQVHETKEERLKTYRNKRDINQVDD